MKHPKRRAKSAKYHAKSANQLDREIAEALGARGPRHKRKPAPSQHAPKTPDAKSAVQTGGLPMVQVRMTQNGPQVLAHDVRPINTLKTLRRLDHEASIALITRQRELHQQLAGVAEALLTQVSKTHDHAAGFRHAPETCATCATIEKEQR